ncbi:MAG: hypothetical protein LBO69_06355 [Ignavibacteria bacterium]|jgi:hypothetical protein|nr:hypothetical protein [Ignavibacteria bacterium]
MNHKYIPLMLCLLSLNILAQEPKQETTKPLELPVFIIEGVEQHSLRSSIKQMPEKIAPLTSQELDSLNTTEKLQPTLLRADRLPEHYVTNWYSTAYLKASYGLFNTPDISAGCRLWIDRFDIAAFAGFSMSEGDAPKSDNNKIFLELKSTYVADEKYFIFGGSSTKTNFYFNTQGYNFYGIWEKPNKSFGNKVDSYDRHLTQGKFEVQSDGAFENILFSVGGNANYILGANNSDASKYIITKDLEDTHVEGFLTIKNYWKHFLLGGNIDLNVEQFCGNSLNYFQFDGSASYFDEKISVLANVGFQIANNSADISRGGLLLRGDLEYRISHLWTMNLGVSTGLEKTDFEDIVSVNPYISQLMEIDHRYDIVNLKGTVLFHPDERIMISGGINWRYSERNISFEMDTLAEYKLIYGDGMVMDLFGESMLELSDIDKLLFKINININSLEDNKNLTYTPIFKLSGTYHRVFWDKFGAELTAEVATNRYIHQNSDATLGSYLLLNLGLDYAINNFVIFMKFNNLANMDYYIWDMYRERGIFGKVGLMWKF